ncbi:MAG TPA: phytanoyl-CoA dioxygenase family protein [Thermoanaerobaculia bacterium]|nr:phytanoyl-CoA dioxygenase family protein [Thermoanaerobaculia bacterium]
MAASVMSAGERALLPTPEQVAEYEAHGWWISPPCIGEEALEELRFGIERYYSGERDWRLPIVSASDWTPADGDVVRQNDFASLQLEEFRAFLLRQPVIAAMAARLARSPSVRLFHDQIVYKPAGRSLQETGVGWHTDRSYWRTCTSARMLTAWIPLADVDERSGTMTVIDGSHLWPDAEKLRRFHERDVDAVQREITPSGAWIEVPYRMRAGQVAFHHCRTIHGSRQNMSDVPRIAWAVHFQDEDNRWQPATNPDGTMTPHMNDLLCRKTPDGTPDYRDPDVCPELWREEPYEPFI